MSDLDEAFRILEEFIRVTRAMNRPPPAAAQAVRDADKLIRKYRKPAEAMADRLARELAELKASQAS